jgi:hypothetical protein
MKIVDFSLEGNSLPEMISMDPVRWTVAAKAKAVARIVLRLPCMHSFGLIHDPPNAQDNIFHVDHHLQITIFSPIRFEVGESEKVRAVFSGEKWSPDPDTRGFVSILFEIIVGHPAVLSGAANDQKLPRRDISLSVSELILSGQSRECGTEQPFHDTFHILTNDNFEMMSKVDSVDVLACVDWVESFE